MTFFRPNKQFFLSFENFEKGLIVLYVRDLPVIKDVAVTGQGHPVQVLSPLFEPVHVRDGHAGQNVHDDEDKEEDKGEKDETVQVVGQGIGRRRKVAQV